MSSLASPGSSTGHNRRTMPAKRSNLKKKTPLSENGGRKSRTGAGERTVKRLRLSKALTIPDATTVSDACRRMAARRVDAALLTDANALLCGIVTDKDVTQRVIAEGLNADDTPVSRVMTKNPIFCMTDTLAVEALQRMVQGKFRHLPVVENGAGGMEVVALLDITKCLYDAIARMERAAEKGNAIAAAVEGVERQWGSSTINAPTSFIDTLRERMFRPTLATLVGDSTKVATVLPSDTIYVAARKMKEFRVSSVVVTAPGSSKPAGILTTKDILMRVVALNLPTEATPVEKVMTPNPECASLDTTIVDALHTMHDGKFLHLPIVDRDGNLVACVDVLQLTHGAVATVGRGDGADAGNSSTLFQKFWDSAMALERDDDTDSFHGSDISGRIAPSEVMSERYQEYITAGMGRTFAYKMEDSSGRIHRFNSGTESLTELLIAIASRVGEDVSPSDLPPIMYEDEDGDKVLLASDADLMAAITTARAQQWKVLKLHLVAETKGKHRRGKSSNSRSSSKLTNWTPPSQSIPEDDPWVSLTSIVTISILAAAIAGGVIFYIKRDR